MNCNLYKKALSKSFSMGSDKYEKWALAQRRIAKDLVYSIDKNLNDLEILDIGCGTGFLIEEIMNRGSFKNLDGLDIAPRMIDLCRKKWSDNLKMNFYKMDIEKQSPKNNSYDLILSNCCFQWFLDPQNTLQRIQTILKQNGQLVFSLLWEESYREIRQSMNHVLGHTDLLHQLPSLTEYDEILNNLPFRKIVKESNEFTEIFPNAFEALKSLNKIGASLKFQENYRPLRKSEIESICHYYEKTYSIREKEVPLSHSYSIYKVYN